MEIQRTDGVADLSSISAVTALSPEQRAEQKKLIQAVKAVNDAELFGQDAGLTFSYDRQTRTVVVKLVNKETDEVIRQIPAEYLLRLAADAEKTSS
jgi:flagellar protein FlaG